MLSLVEYFSLEKEDATLPANDRAIMQYQQNNDSLIETAKSNKYYSIKRFHRSNEKYSFICIKHKKYDPQSTKIIRSTMVS